VTVGASTVAPMFSSTQVTITSAGSSTLRAVAR
jgi:hypothetical protein